MSNPCIHFLLICCKDSFSFKRKRYFCRMKKWILAIFCFLPLFSVAQLIACRQMVKDGYNFWLYLPDDYADTVSERKPVIMFLHGKSLSGNDLSLVRKYGPLDALAKGREIDAIVIAPQTNDGWSPKKVLNVYDWVKEHYVLDTNRFYVIGMSMGGYGTLDFAATYPEKVAAAIAMCGGCSVRDVCGLNDIPLWIIHGTADKSVPIANSQAVVNAMHKCGPIDMLRFTKLPRGDHGTPARVFYLKETYEWLFSHSRSSLSRRVNSDFEITMSVLKNAYSDLSGKQKTLKVKDLKPDKVKTVENVKTASDSVSEIYRVKSGDTLSKIAQKHGTTVSQLCKLNHLKESDILQLGQKIKVR